MLEFDKPKIEDYVSYLKTICSLSKLFTDSEVPYLHYRIAENIFCKVFNAENLSRLDIAYDAKINNVGIGLKTFIDKKTNSEKIAEFDKKSHEIKQFYSKRDELIQYIAELRNKRIDFANRSYGINESIYHCVARRKNKVIFFNIDYNKININKIKINEFDEKKISFICNNDEYSFVFSKSTLYKKFYVSNKYDEFDIKILNEPLEIIHGWFKSLEVDILTHVHQTICLPLYSIDRRGKKYVAEKSGLNQWNAGGRKRDFGEVYIQVPSFIHQSYPKFFPKKNICFELEIPTEECLTAKICQDGGKALMTNPNKKLADWLLRTIFNLKEGELLIYEKLESLNIDSVLITKLSDEKFHIDFTSIDSYEKFKLQNDRKF